MCAMSNEPESNVDPPRVEAGALDHVVDDLEARRQCADWVRAELLDGRTPEQIVSELAAAGWPADDAEGIVEDGRRQTRAERGVVTRDDVVREANRRYRGAMGTGIVTGLPTAASAKRLFYAILNVLALGRFRRRDK
jgi:hypothetical protein